MYYHRTCNDFGAFGRVYASVLVEYKFIFIAACFGVALVSYFFCRSVRDWLWLMLGLAFTLAADYFLVLHDRHLVGVAIFCFTHAAYIMRAVAASSEPSRGVFSRLPHRKKAWHRVLLIGLGLLMIVPAYTALSQLLGGLYAFNTRFAATTVITGIYVIAALYAALFIINIYISARYIQHNRVLIVAGLLLFAACDICVLIFNLPRYFGAPVWLNRVFPLIWVFYLPSQLMLALSAIRWQKSLRDY